AVVDALASSGAAMAKCAGGAAELIDAMGGRDAVVIVDAVGSNDAAPGEILGFDASEAPLPAAFGFGSTHALGVADAIELARALGRLPRRVVVHGIVGGDFGHGTGLTPAVRRAVDAVATRVLADLAAYVEESREGRHA
ncbi:MAG: hydrogenase maturation protease, partial [Myxococcales bacterium]|nr:hydrogenase maturation protease [Myxococcales bacterium]